MFTNQMLLSSFSIENSKCKEAHYKGIYLSFSCLQLSSNYYFAQPNNCTYICNHIVANS